MFIVFMQWKKIPVFAKHSYFVEHKGALLSRSGRAETHNSLAARFAAYTYRDSTCCKIIEMLQAMPSQIHPLVHFHVTNVLRLHSY